MRLTELQQDQKNANRGKARGQEMIRQSLQQCGAGRSLLVDAQNNVIAGNKSLEALVEVGLEDAIVVETDGTRPVVVKRTDLDLYSEEDPRARRLAYLDNLSSHFGFEIDPKQVAIDAAGGLDFTGLLTEGEQAGIFRQAEREARGEVALPPDDGQREAPAGAQEKYPLAVVLDADGWRRWQAWKQACGEKLDTKALLVLMERAEV